MRLSKGDQRRVLVEDVLKHLHDCRSRGVSATEASAGGALGVGLDRIAKLLPELVEAGLVERRGDCLELTVAGEGYALSVIRAHRLYETYLADRTGTPLGEWHRRAEVEEHRLSPVAQDRLADSLGNPRFDPHGDPIPTRGGEVVAQAGRPLSGFVAGEDLVVTHMEDEPEEVFSEIAKLRLAPGMRLRVLGCSRGRLRVEVEGLVQELSLVAAERVHAVLSPAGGPAASQRRLSAISLGESARVLGISPACRGSERTRLLDLGVVPGSIVEAAFSGPLGDPTAYRLRGTMVGLRREQAEQIFVERI
ncbi:MAG TPA: metal-dependent transcriptional regulator [Verrucomicrobiae bacterium]|nr:metal-dependent transcriptional regulator [Verrucomicrobiae bacterium]